MRHSQETNIRIGCFAVECIPTVEIFFFLADVDVPQCTYCTGPSSYNCPISSQICSLSPKSLGVSQCGSAVGKYMNENGLKRNVFYRGCFDNVGK